MKRLMYVFAALLLLLGMVPAAWAGAKEEVAAATQAWADAVNSKDLERILAVYDAEAVLWGTVSPTLRDSPAAIREYFTPGASRPNLKVALGEQRVRVYGNIAINTGITRSRTFGTASRSPLLRDSALSTVSAMAAG